MKKLILFSFVFVLFTSCVTSRGHFQKNPDVTINESYETKGRVEGKAISERVWILFIPIGGISDQGLYNRAYKKATEEKADADGVTSQIVEYHKVKIPLLLFTYVHKDLTVSGTAYKIKQN